MSNSGSRLYLTCRIFRRAASWNCLRIKIRLLSLRRARFSESVSPLPIRCKPGAKVIRPFSKAHPQLPGLKVLPRQSSSQFGFPDAAQIPRQQDGPTPKSLFRRWSKLATYPGRFGEHETPGASVLVFERAGSHEGGRSRQDANSG